MGEPTTEAGRALLDTLRREWHPDPPYRADASILAIEAEAHATIDWPAQRRISEQQGQINGLREENERLREALKLIKGYCSTADYINGTIIERWIDDSLLADKPVGAGKPSGALDAPGGPYDPEPTEDELRREAERHG